MNDVQFSDIALWHENGRLPEHVHIDACDALLQSCREAALRPDLNATFDLADRARLFRGQYEQTLAVGYGDLAAKHEKEVILFERLAKHTQNIWQIHQAALVAPDVTVITSLETELRVLETGVRMTVNQIVRAAQSGKSHLCDCAIAFGEHANWIFDQCRTAMEQRKRILGYT